MSLVSLLRTCEVRTVYPIEIEARTVYPIEILYPNSWDYNRANILTWFGK